MTVQIAICDDETVELEKTVKLLSSYEQKHGNVDFCGVKTGKVRCKFNQLGYKIDMNRIKNMCYNFRRVKILNIF